MAFFDELSKKAQAVASVATEKAKDAAELAKINVMAVMPCGTVAVGMTTICFSVRPAHCSAAIMIFLLLGRMKTVSAGIFSTPSRMLSVEGFMVCPPDTTPSAPRSQNRAASPSPAQTDRKPYFFCGTAVLGDGSSVGSASRSSTLWAFLPAARSSYWVRMSEILPYLGIEPDYTAEELVGADAMVPDVVGSTLKAAEAKLTESGFSYRTVGSGETVTDQTPVGGAIVPNNAAIILYLGAEKPNTLCTVPKVTGLSASAANQALTNAGLIMKVTGATTSSSGNVYAISQSVQPEAQVEAGTVVTVQLGDSSVLD